MKKLPVIDIAPLYDVNHPDYADICNQIDQACREWDSSISVVINRITLQKFKV
jgi:isopenicillin N synthase-like dioxygenase